MTEREYDPDTGQAIVYVAFCPRCGDRKVPYMNTHLTDEGEWTCPTDAFEATA